MSSPRRIAERAAEQEREDALQRERKARSAWWKIQDSDLDEDIKEILQELCERAGIE